MQYAAVDHRQFRARATERATTCAAHRQMHSATDYQQFGGQRAQLSTARRRGQGVARARCHPRPESATAAGAFACLNIPESICGQKESTFLRCIVVHL